MRHGGEERLIRAGQIDLAALDRGRAAFVNDIDPCGSVRPGRRQGFPACLREQDLLHGKQYMTLPISHYVQPEDISCMFSQEISDGL